MYERRQKEREREEDSWDSIGMFLIGSQSERIPSGEEAHFLTLFLI